MIDTPTLFETSYQWLDVFNTYLTLPTLVVSAYTAWQLWRRKKAWRQVTQRASPAGEFAAQFESHRDSTSANPFALSINLLPDQVTCEPDVRRYYQDRGQAVPAFAEISRPGITAPAADLAALLREVRDKRIYLDAEAATEVHVFFAGPLAAALHVGAALDNWKLVKVFQMGKVGGERRYEYWGVL